jgi:NAD-dependent dihydropyrimidine dehydrogenase PreA subunit
MPYYQTIVYSPGVQAGAAPPGGADEIIVALAASDAAFEVVPDICQLAAGGDPAMRRWSGATDLRIAGLPRRAVKWLFHAAGQTLPETAEVLDPKTAGPDEIVRGLLAGAEEGGNAATHGQDGCRGLQRPAPTGQAGPEQPRLSAAHGLDAHATDGHGASHDTPKQEALGGGTDQFMDHDAHATGLAEAMTVMLYEGPGARVMTPRRRAELILAAVAAGYRVVRPAPCGSPHAGDSQGPADTSALAIVGEFEGGNIPPGLGGPWGKAQAGGAGAVCIDACGKCACGTIGAVDEARAAMHLPKPGAWAAWFPVIDYDRCAGCKQCANFCLFGVFSTDDGGVRVATPASCKTNCPACARMCPQSAIIFPHYPTGPINGQEAGEQPGDGDAAVSLKEALRGDVYQVLRGRGQGGAASLAAAKAALGAGKRDPADGDKCDCDESPTGSERCCCQSDGGQQETHQQ